MRNQVYYRIFANNISTQLGYRWNILTGFGLQVLQILVSIFTWTAILAQGEVINGYSLDDIITYLILVSLSSSLFSTAHFFRLSPLVRNGRLNRYLVRPYSFVGDSFATFVAQRCIDLIFLGVFIGISFSLFQYNPQITFSGLAIVLLFSNILLLFFFGMTIGVLSFWLIQMWPIRPLYTALMGIIGGTVFPLDLLPAWIGPWISYSPFALFGYVNVRAFQGAFDRTELQGYIIASLLWSAVFFIAYQILWRVGLRKYELSNT
jgi:ABC-2 type transport system permease protein